MRSKASILNESFAWGKPCVGFSVAVSSLLCLNGLLFVGCGSDLRDVDARTDALVRERSGLLGKSAQPARPRNATPDDSRDPAITRKVPQTTNPDASDLRYTPADEAREVAKRLESYEKFDGEPLRIDLVGAFKQAQLTSRELVSAEEEYILAAIRLLIQRHSFDWRFFADTTVSAFADGTDGVFTSPLNVMQDLGVRRQFENGGKFEARLVWSATEQLRKVATDRYVQSSSLVLSGNIPLLRGAGTVASDGLIQAERELVYAARAFEDFRRAFLVSLARDYFAIDQQRAAIVNQERQLQSLMALAELKSALEAAGRIPQFETNIAKNTVLEASRQLADLRVALILALDRFKIRLGLSIDKPIEIAPITLEIREPLVTPEEAAALALEYRLDLQTQRDRVDDARRSVANARNGVLPDLNLSGSATARTKASAREGGFVYEPGDALYQGSITFGLPLDRENERLALRASQIGLERSLRNLDVFRDNLVVEVRGRVRDIDTARFRLTLAEQGVELNRKRMEEQELKRGELDSQKIVDTQNALLKSENDRDQATTDLRNAILGYLLASGQLRVERDGTLLPLPGMQKTEPVPASNP